MTHSARTEAEIAAEEFLQAYVAINFTTLINDDDFPSWDAAMALNKAEVMLVWRDDDDD